MTATITLEIVGYADSECSPFPCDETRTCGLTSCAPSGSLVEAVEAVKKEIKREFADQVIVKLTLLDESVPDYIREIYEREHPAIPMILVEGKVIPIGRISWIPIREAIATQLSSLPQS